MPRAFRSIAALLATVLVLPLAACSEDGGSRATGRNAAADGRLRVVASTNVYVDIAAAVGGDAVDATPLISRPDQDPHAYEATVRDRLNVSKADLVIVNGGGYDPFMSALIQADRVGGAVIDAVAVSGRPANEHVWYSLAAMVALVPVIKDELAARRPADAQAFAANASALTGKLSALERRLATLKNTAPADGTGRDVVVTEPVPLYLLADAGLRDVTPPSFAHAVEAGGSVSPADLKSVRDLLAQRRVAFLAYNPQTETAQTRSLASAAADAGVPVVDFAETLPVGTRYADWMSANVSAVESALRASR
ncbi:metal ABC transporter solute-binding protein, Zn/Mn family [Tersicoccus phoenicis]|uniref:metal ABC transporter solute-binding protein, Zn/Mn family n=1 Tax=Tersicoccus phoenicis TaxID=554083 RepID=UPI001F2650B0|nr:zinc ABC transporter substrate-binding protein [Tersicoccus phoenicis]